MSGMKPDATERNTLLSPNAEQAKLPGSLPPPSRSSPPVPAKRFVDEGELGRGGMAVVRRVRDESLLRTVAMKRLDPGASDGTRAPAERLVEEAQITGQLDHPNIVPVHELGSDEAGRPYIVMKLVSGHTLASVLARSKPPRDPEELADLLGVFLTVCDAISFAHSKGVVHCDLKPQNVMVDAFGQVYVMDWGLARVMSDAAAPQGAAPSHLVRSRSGPPNPDEAAGTVWYMAPEQVRPRWRPIGPRTDVFALGAVLYEILTGRPPHEGDDALALRLNAFECRITPPDRVYPSVPAPLARIVMKALERDPADRWQKVDDLRRAVERFLRGGEQFVTRRFPAGTLVVGEGDVGDAAYVIIEGQCRAFKGRGEGRVVLRDMGPGDVFGELAVLSDKPRTASVEAVTELVVREVKAETMAEGLGLHTWMGAFVRALADRFREADGRLTALLRAKDEE